MPEIPEFFVKSHKRTIRGPKMSRKLPRAAHTIRLEWARATVCYSCNKNLHGPFFDAVADNTGGTLAPSCKTPVLPEPFSSNIGIPCTLGRHLLNPRPHFSWTFDTGRFYGNLGLFCIQGGRAD